MQATTRPRLARKQKQNASKVPTLQDASLHKAFLKQKTAKGKVLCARCSVQVAVRKLLCASCVIPLDEQVYVLNECPPAQSIGKTVIDRGYLFIWDPQRERSLSCASIQDW